MWNLISPTRDQTVPPALEAQSSPLDHQGHLQGFSLTSAPHFFSPNDQLFCVSQDNFYFFSCRKPLKTYLLPHCKRHSSSLVLHLTIYALKNSTCNVHCCSWLSTPWDGKTPLPHFLRDRISDIFYRYIISSSSILAYGLCLASSSVSFSFSHFIIPPQSIRSQNSRRTI